MHEYGATNPAEFFAVATETFFEKPVQLKNKHPELYEELYGAGEHHQATAREKIMVASGQPRRLVDSSEPAEPADLPRYCLRQTLWS